MVLFIAILFVVDAYVWLKGGLEWERPVSRQRAASMPRALAAEQETARRAAREEVSGAR